MVEVKFKPADVGTVADGAITDVKVAANADIDVSKLSGAVSGKKADTTGDKDITAIGWNDTDKEIIIDHEA